jgi:hypothetical protein
MPCVCAGNLTRDVITNNNSCCCSDFVFPFRSNCRFGKSTWTRQPGTLPPYDETVKSGAEIDLLFLFCSDFQRNELFPINFLRVFRIFSVTSQELTTGCGLHGASVPNLLRIFLLPCLLTCVARVRGRLFCL